MLKSLDLPITAAGQNLILPREIEKSAYVLYRETADGLIYAGLYDPDISDEDYLDGIYKIPLRSTYLRTAMLDRNSVVYNVHGSSDDTSFVVNGVKYNWVSWVGVWQYVMNQLNLTPNDRKCYVRSESEPDAPCPAIEGNIVGGHLTFNPNGIVNVQNEVYLLPICKHHNYYRNIFPMRPTCAVYAIVMMYKYDV